VQERPLWRNWKALVFQNVGSKLLARLRWLRFLWWRRARLITSNIIDNANKSLLLSFNTSSPSTVIKQTQSSSASSHVYNFSYCNMWRSTSQETILCNPVSARASGLPRELCSSILTRVRLCFGFVQVKAFRAVFLLHCRWCWTWLILLVFITGIVVDWSVQFDWWIAAAHSRP